MIRTLTLRNLGHLRGLLLSLLGGLMTMELVIVWIAASIESDSALLELIQRVLPRGMQAFVETQIGFLSFPGMVGFGFQHPAILTGAIAFVFVICTLPAAERESGFLDLILARPISRSTYLSGVLLTLLIGAVLLPLALVLGTAIGLSIVDDPEKISWTRYLFSAGEFTALLLCIGGYTLLFAVGAKRRGPAVALATGLTLFFFWFDLMTQLWVPLRSFGWLTPFNYFDPIQAALQPTRIFGPLVLLSAFAITTALAYQQIRRRDL